MSYRLWFMEEREVRNSFCRVILKEIIQNIKRLTNKCIFIQAELKIYMYHFI